MPDRPLFPIERITQSIYLVRGTRVIFDSDLAPLYDVSIKALNQAVQRNGERFPEDFVFQLTDAEWSALRSQIVTLKNGRGTHRKYLPYVFTEHGAYMLGNVLRSTRAAEVSVYIVRAFVRLRETLATNKVLAARIDDLERTLATHDKAIVELLRSLKRLTALPDSPQHQIGFTNKKRAR